MYLKFIVYKNGSLDGSPDQMPEFLHVVCLYEEKQETLTICCVHTHHAFLL